MQPYNNHCLKVHIGIVMSCRARNLGCQMGNKQGTLQEYFSEWLHTKTTNIGGCLSQSPSHPVSLLVCCTTPNGIAHRRTNSHGSDVTSKALLYEGVHVFHQSGLLHCRLCLLLYPST